MSQRRRKKPKARPIHPSGPRPAAFRHATQRPAGQPVQTARPLVTSQMSYVLEPVFDLESPTLPLGTLAPTGSPGTYRVTVVFAVPGRNVVQEGFDFPAMIEAGDSLLAVAPDVDGLRLVVNDPAGGATNEATVEVNKFHRLRSIVMEYEALNFVDATEIAHNLVAPLLSRWSFLHDVAITTSGLEIIEVATSIQSCQLTMVGAVKTFSDTAGGTDPDHRVLLSAYREGISSAEPLWQALCLYKVAEGVWAMRKRRTDAALASGTTPSEPAERVPDDLSNVGHPNDRRALVEALGPYVGKKFHTVFDNVRGTLRNAIAHIDPACADPLAHDKWDDLQRVQNMLPALRWMSRQLLDAELQAHPR